MFSRSRRAEHAGRPEVKAAFAEIAHKTLGIPSRMERIAIVARDMRARGLKTGIYRRRSRARIGSPLHGKVYETRAAT